jgi:hypothetical protein
MKTEKWGVFDSDEGGAALTLGWVWRILFMRFLSRAVEGLAL